MKKTTGKGILPRAPDFELEDQYTNPVCGIDEVGRGPLAGPVVAACVYIPDAVRPLEWITEIKDSKKLSWKKLEALYALITENCPHGIAEISPQEIDEINILQASLKAMGAAYTNMDEPACTALIDGNKMPDLPCPAQTVVKGDSKSVSIASASIIAKVTRDRIMHALAEEHPHYSWKTNVGYPSKAHRDAIDAHGITNHHRRSFAPIRNFIDQSTTRKA